MYPNLYEDSDLLVIHKPAGVVVNRAKSVRGTTIQDYMDDILSSQNAGRSHDNAEFRSRSGIVHRLDKETSGILILSKNPTSFANLKAQFKKRRVKKRYIALVHGIIKPQSGEVNAPVGRLPWNRMRFGIHPEGRSALTAYKAVSEHYDEKREKYTLVSLTPTTGRTHQIRVHLQYIGHPIVSDPLYAGRRQAKNDRRWCRRLFLHASEIKFTHPSSGELMHITCPLPDDLAGALDTLKQTVKP